VKGESELVANQVHKDYKCSNLELAKYLAEVRKLERRFDGIEVRHVYQKDNVEPDDLAHCASKQEPLEPKTFLDILTKPSFKDTHDESTTANTDIRLGAVEVAYVVANIGTTDNGSLHSHRQRHKIHQGNFLQIRIASLHSHRQQLPIH
jgi:hypothetical protein